ncbi:MAG: alginate lyase family protein [Candidatus Sumerlaeia bacterium]|nr:alginate lyase family protein [Candidatus Sumerlaeia bacterium]
MPSLAWYVQRLSAMSPAEIPWRLSHKVRDEVGRFRSWPTAEAIPFSSIWNGPATLIEWRAAARSPLPAKPAEHELASWPEEWRTRCLAEAEDLLAHRVTFFHLERHDLGEAIDWNRDCESGKTVPVTYAPRLDYRAANRVGDVKIVWELNRMQHLVRLAQAWLLTHDDRFAREVVAQIQSWIAQCPYMHGINWTSAMEVSLRALAWTWAVEYILDWDGLDDEFFKLLARSVHQHLDFVDRHYSLHSSANNHLVAEAGCACVVSSWWSGLRGASRWHQHARAHLERECLRQNWPDGVNKEQAFFYQFFVFDLFFLPALQARRTGNPFPKEYHARLEAMAEFLAWVTDSAGNTPRVGDEDGGLALRLTWPHANECHGLLNTAAAYFARADFKAWAGGVLDEKSAWLLQERDKLDYSSLETPQSRRASRLFPEGGYAVLREGEGASEMLALLDVGPLGWPATAAHGHADALALCLHLGGVPILSDPGTWSYRDNNWRVYLRSTPQHSTLQFGENNQAQYLNRFMWGKRFAARLREFEACPESSVVVGDVTWWSGEHHERRLEWHSDTRQLRIVDVWHGTRPASIVFVLHPGIHARAVDERSVVLSVGDVTLQFTVDCGELAIEPMKFSPRCYVLVPSIRLVVRGLPAAGRAACTLQALASATSAG